MITVKRNGLSITINGHANSAECGKDLICASASILFYTLVENVGQMERKGKCKAQIKALEGDAEVKIAVLPAYFDEAVMLIEHIMVGYEILSSEYPEYIRIVNA